MEILVLAAHPDDEVLGMGGTIKKLTKKGHKVSLCVVSEGSSAQYTDKKLIQVRKKDCLASSKILGISKVEFLELPDMKLDTISHLEINKKLESIITRIKPKIVFSTPFNDLNLDHKKVYESCLIATRPLSTSVKEIYCYEIPGIKQDPFNPNVYENISKELTSKIKAFKMYKSEVRKFPHPRSVEAIKNLAIFRGIESGLKNAEAFQLIRKIND
jgi:LmbE family N-acetylglucosaminyl deacetylase